MTEKLVTIKEFFQWGVKQGAQNTPLAQLRAEFEALDWVAEKTVKAMLEAKWRKEALAETLNAEPLTYSLI